jgi:hypothetical protein
MRVEAMTLAMLERFGKSMFHLNRLLDKQTDGLALTIIGFSRRSCS